MSEEKNDLRWATFSETPNIIDAVRYVVLEKDGKKLNNFERILERAGINGRISQDGDHIRVSSKNGRRNLSDGKWLVMDRLGELEVYSDVDFNKLFEAGSPVSSEQLEGANATVPEMPKLSDGFAKLEEKMNNVISALNGDVETLKKETKALDKQIAYIKNQKGANNVKSNTSKS